MKKKVIILLKKKSWWSDILIKKMSKIFKCYVEILDDYQNLTFKGQIEKFNYIIKKKKIFYAFFEGDYPRHFSSYFINNIKINKKFLISMDDYDCHGINKYTATACDGVLSACPESVGKYNSKKINCLYFPIESDEKIFKNLNLKKKIDILSFGELKEDIKKYIDFLYKNNFHVEHYGDGSNYLSFENLVKKINQSKLVINFSKASASKMYGNEIKKKKYYQWKGRILITGFCNSVCITEKTPQIKYILNKKNIITFNNKKSLKIKLKYYLNHHKALDKLRINFNKNCQKYLDINYLAKVKDFCNDSKSQRALKMPKWYFLYFFKQILKKKMKNKFKKLFDILYFINFLHETNK